MFDHQLQRDVLAIATDDGRMVGSCGHERARTYLLGRMHDIGLSPFRGNTLDLPYTAPGLSPGVEFHNLIGVVHGDERERRLHAPCSSALTTIA